MIIEHTFFQYHCKECDFEAHPHEKLAELDLPGGGLNV